MASVSGDEDVWIPSVCGMCPDQCGILVHRVAGVVTKIEGNPQSPLGRGRLCARGLAGIQLLYDPYRLNQPLKRGNPEKGIGVDPRWQPISWDEALEAIVERLKHVRAEDPRRLLFCGTPTSSGLAFALNVFMPAFGSPNAFLCDEHALARAGRPDADLCEYLLLFGADCTSGAAAGKMADARVRGMRMVAVEPFLSPAAEKADEWLPIRPGGQGALACALLNLLLNEYRLFDAEHIRCRTDGPYLVRADGGYARDAASGLPLVWDAAAGRACPLRASAFDEDGADAAIEGMYSIEGEDCRPVFQLLREAVRHWTPGAAAEATTIPADTIRRIAREFGEAARIGSTVAIESHELPLRPVAAVCGPGALGHDSARPTALAIALLNEVVGAGDVPGGLLGSSPVSFGHPQTGLPRWAPVADRDGLLQAGLVPGHDFIGLPFASNRRPEVLIDQGSNLLMSAAGAERCLEAFKDCFVVSVSLYSDETAEALADIVLPDACYLERLDAPDPSRRFPAGRGDWVYQLGQPAVRPLFERRPFSEVLLEIGERLGLAGAMNDTTNLLWGLQPPHALSPEERCSWEEMVDRVCQGWFGPEHGMAWFRQNGVLAWPKRVEEAYPRPFGGGRVPLSYNGLPDWRPSEAQQPQIGFDLQAVSYQVPWHASFTCQNPWLDEVSQSEPYSYLICLNPRAAAAKGIADGDAIWVESTSGRRVRGRVRLSENVHPKAVAIAENGGHWARGMPVARGEGAFFNALLTFDPEHTDLDPDARVRVYKE